MEGAIIARVLHVLGVVLWIGGMAFVTSVLLPAVKRMREPAEGVGFFEKVESGFARQARVTTLLTGLSGFYLVHRLGAWVDSPMPITGGCTPWSWCGACSR